MTQGQIRIIGGQWRGRKLKVPDLPGLRPTPNRIRETLFNWLAPVIAETYCLDAFAGSGALGLEALSRGAKQVTFIDESKDAIQCLHDSIQILKTDRAEIYCAKAPNQLKKPKHHFDIVFLDPPFQHNLLIPCCFYLEENDFLSDTAYIYLESKEVITAAELPFNWELIKSKKTGQVAYHLALRKHE